MLRPDPRTPTGTSNQIETVRKLKARDQENTILEVVNGRLERQTNGYRIIIPKQRLVASGGGSSVKLYSITAVQNDYLTCQEIKADGSLLGIDVNIARPRELRASTDSGGSFSYPNANTRRVVQNGVNVDELITPAYAVGDEIEAATLVRTSVVVGTERLTVEDLNAAGRQWRFAKREVEVCVGGVTKHMQGYFSAAY